MDFIESYSDTDNKNTKAIHFIVEQNTFQKCILKQIYETNTVKLIKIDINNQQIIYSSSANIINILPIKPYKFLFNHIQ